MYPRYFPLDDCDICEEIEEPEEENDPEEI
jgi:hypothetical protein